MRKACANWQQGNCLISKSQILGLTCPTRIDDRKHSHRHRVFATPWQKIVTSTEALAQAHHTLAQNILADVETPIRDFAAGSSEMQAMANISGNLRAIAKETDSANKKAEKLREKGGKAAAGKVASAATEVENAQGQWDSQAPYVFERLQAVDEARVDHQRNGLTQFQTHVIECFSAVGSSAEECLNALLNIQTADEITTFALKTTRSLPTITTTASGRRKSTVQEPVAPPTTDAGSSLAPVPSLPRQDEISSNRSGSSRMKHDLISCVADCL
jgi:F-BAR domain only protein